MRIAIAGASGRIGRLTSEQLSQAGHEVVSISRGSGIDLTTGAGLDAALMGVGAVVDVTNSSATDEATIVDFFTTTTRRLLAAEQAAGVRHHVLLSIVGIHGGATNAHYAGKRAQEAEVVAGAVPYTIVAATQFHDFADMIVSRTMVDGIAYVPPLLMQPIAPADVAAALVRTAVGPADNRRLQLAGPHTEDLVDMARRSAAARGVPVELRPTWRGRGFGVSMAGEALLPGTDAELAPTTFADWLVSCQADSLPKSLR